MATSKKRAVSPKGNADLVERLRPLTAVAVAKLQDPEFRARLKENAQAMSDFVVSWRDARAESDADDRAGGRRMGDVGQHFGQRRLERRVENARTAVQTLGRERPDLAAELEPLVMLVDQMSLSLSVASGLPVVKRKRAHLKLDRTLDRLEEQLLGAVLPAP